MFGVVLLKHYCDFDLLPTQNLICFITINYWFIFWHRGNFVSRWGHFTWMETDQSKIPLPNSVISEIIKSVRDCEHFNDFLFFILWWKDILGRFSALFTKVDSFCTCLFAYLYTKPLWKWGQLLTARICSSHDYP